MSHAAHDTTTGETTLNQKVGYAFGAIYVLVGILGFFFTDTFVGPAEGDKLLGIFAVNHLHNIVHIVIGVALIGAARSGDAAARSTNFTIGVIYAVLGLVGWFIDGDSSLNFANLNVADHLLHLVTAAVLIGVSRADRTDRARTA